MQVLCVLKQSITSVRRPVTSDAAGVMNTFSCMVQNAFIYCNSTKGYIGKILSSTQRPNRRVKITRDMRIETASR